jgi:hypothetical protein
MTLAVIPQSPAGRSPGSAAHSLALQKARGVLLVQWLHRTRKTRAWAACSPCRQIKLEPGRHVVRAVDDAARADSREVTVTVVE